MAGLRQGCVLSKGANKGARGNVSPLNSGVRQKHSLDVEGVEVNNRLNHAGRIAPLLSSNQIRAIATMLVLQ